MLKEGTKRHKKQKQQQKRSDNGLFIILYGDGENKRN